MSSSTSPSNTGSQDDPWEQLAEDLFGLEYGKEHAGHDEALPPESAAHAAPAPPPSEHSPSEPPRSFVPPYEAPAAPPSEAVEAPPRFAAERIEESEEFAPDEQGARAEDQSGEPLAAETIETPRPVSPQDSYWDALANWNWDESEGGSGKPRSDSRSEPSRTSGGPPQRGGSRGRDEGRGRRGGDRRERQERSSSAPAPPPAPPRPPRQSTPGVADDFGLGVEGEQPGFQPPAEQSAAEAMREPDRTADRGPSAPAAGRDAGAGSAARGEGHRGHAAGGRHGERSSETGDEGDGSRKRRRRRRRRRGSRGGEGEAGATAAGAPAGPGADWDDSAGPEADEPEAGNEPVAESPVGETDDERPSRGGPGRRHARRRDEEPVSSAGEPAPAAFDDDEDYEPEEMTLAGGEQTESEMESAADDESDDESGEHTINYENVPTWEEAISYLLHPNQVQVESGAGGGANPRGGAAADQPRQTRHIGHRKNRR